MGKTKLVSQFLKLTEFIRSPIAQHRMMMACRLQVLADSDQVDFVLAQIAQCLLYLVTSLTQPKHDARLGWNLWLARFERLQ